jgi:hypothetical protein
MRLMSLIAAGLLFSGTATAQTYTKTETITYSNDTAKWVIGQTATVTDLGTGLVQSATTFSPTTAMPLTTSVFGKLQSTATYNGASVRNAGDYNITRLPHPIRQVTTTQQGRTFTWQVASGCGGMPYCFVAFARPTKVVKTSTP